jgi:hypothetical protein
MVEMTGLSSSFVFLAAPIKETVADDFFSFESASTDHLISRLKRFRLFFVLPKFNKSLDSAVPVTVRFNLKLKLVGKFSLISIV